MTRSLTYADAGVDIDKANRLVDKIKEIAKKTPRHGVMGEIGGFGGLFSLNVDGYEKPVLVSSTDGVGTKLKIAFMTNIHGTIGIDLVAMCVNDIAVQGAKPLFFLDYVSMGTLDEGVVPEIIQGIGEGCRLANCALIGGETAEMPGLYSPGEYDLAGFAVGLVDNARIIDGAEIRMGDVLIGIASSGLHSNGFSLVRKICFDMMGLSVDTHIPELGHTLGEALLAPTRIYSETVQMLIRDLPIRGFAHITGGGITENIVRIIPQACDVRIRRNSWEWPAIFHFLQSGGKVSEAEMLRTFNTGIGMIAVVPEERAGDVLDRLQAMGERAWAIGEITARKDDRPTVEWVD